MAVDDGYAGNVEYSVHFWVEKVLPDWASQDFSLDKFLAERSKILELTPDQWLAKFSFVDFSPLIKLCLGAEIHIYSVNQVKTLCKAAKTASSEQMFKNALASLDPPVEYTYTSLSMILDHLDKSLAAIRAFTMPPRKGKRDPIKEKNTLDNFDKLEASLLKKLKNVRAERELYLKKIGETQFTKS